MPSQNLGELFTQVWQKISQMHIHVCISGEYNSTTLVPTIQDPDAQTFYLVPESTGNNVYSEWVYVGESWERFGAANLDLSAYATAANPVFTGTISLGRKANTIVGSNSIAIGSNVTASGSSSHAEGSGTQAIDTSAHAEGTNTLAVGGYSHAEGYAVQANGDMSHAEGQKTSSNTYRYSQRNYTYGTANGMASHIEGTNNITIGADSHAEGNTSIAIGSRSHAEGSATRATGENSHSEGSSSLAIGVNSHAEGSYTYARGYASHAEGEGTDTYGKDTHAGGRYNISEVAGYSYWTSNTDYEVGDIVNRNEVYYKCTNAHNSGSIFDPINWIANFNFDYAEIIGNGTADNARSNARALTWTGDEYLAGDVYVHANPNSTGGIKLATLADIPITAKDDTPITLSFGTLTVGDDNNIPTMTLDVTTALEEGPATLVIGTDEIPVHMSITVDDQTTKTYYMTTETLQDGTTPLFALQYTGTGTSSTTVSYMAYSDETYAEDQAVALKFPREKLTTSRTGVYVNCAADGTGGNKLLTSNDLGAYAPISSPVFTGSISMGRRASTTVGNNSVAVGYDVRALGDYAHAEGSSTLANSNCTHAEGSGSNASGYGSHAEGASTTNGTYAHAEGSETTALGSAAHAEGNNTQARAGAAHAEGISTIASESAAHAEGYSTEAHGYYSHAEGSQSRANGEAAHAQGKSTIIYGECASVSGKYNIHDLNNYPSWQPETEYTTGDKIIEDGTAYKCISNHTSGQAFSTPGLWTSISVYDYAEIVGNGTANNARSNARALTWTGDERLAGDLYVQCNSDSTGGSKVATEAFVTARVPAPPVSDGTYNLQVSVSSGTATYSWVSVS